MRYSKQRELVMQTVENLCDHPTAEEIYDTAAKECPGLSLGTVYRNLNLLADIGEALRIPTPDGGDRFDARTNPHYHFYCKCCKRMIDMDFDHMDKINQLASESFDGQIESHTMLFYGICGDCLRKS